MICSAQGGVVYVKASYIPLRHVFFRSSIRKNPAIQKRINHSWQEIVRIGNTQKIVTTYGQNKDNEIIYERR